MKKLLVTGSILLVLASCQNGNISPCAGIVAQWGSKGITDGQKAKDFGILAYNATKAKQYDSAAYYSAQVIAFGAAAKQDADSVLYYTKNCPDSSK